EWASVIAAILDGLRDRKDVDRDRVGLMGISMGGIYGPRAAAHEKRLRAVIALAGPYDLSECWAALNPLTRGGYVFYTRSRDEAVAVVVAIVEVHLAAATGSRIPVRVVRSVDEEIVPQRQRELGGELRRGSEAAEPAVVVSPAPDPGLRSGTGRTIRRVVEMIARLVSRGDLEGPARSGGPRRRPD